jgi:hypothetical protein
MTEGVFKSRLSGHKHDMKNREKYGTTLSRHACRLRDMKIRFEIKWEIKEKASKYNPGGKYCKVCNSEKPKWKLDKIVL